MTKSSKETVDKLLESVYSKNEVTVYTYEQILVEIMSDLNCTISEALDLDFDMHGVDKTSVFDLVDYLEEMFNGDLDKVNLMMQIYTHQVPDFKLKRL